MMMGSLVSSLGRLGSCCCAWAIVSFLGIEEDVIDDKYVGCGVAIVVNRLHSLSLQISGFWQGNRVSWSEQYYLSQRISARDKQDACATEFLMRSVSLTIVSFLGMGQDGIRVDMKEPQQPKLSGYNPPTPVAQASCLQPNPTNQTETCI